VKEPNPAERGRAGKGSGADGKTPIFVACWLRAQRVLRVETFTNSAAALEAAGLSE
jgi:hypothetical protein